LLVNQRKMDHRAANNRPDDVPSKQK